MVKWNKGPPPSVGWWPASIAKRKDCIRWWNGRKWSVAAWDDMDSESAAIHAKVAVLQVHQDAILWTHRPASWPERSKT